MQTNNIVGIQCFHETHSQFFTDYNIASCKFVWTEELVCYHVISLKTPVSIYDLTSLPTVLYHYSQNNYIDEIWEKVSKVPINSLYNIDRKSNISFIIELASQMIQSICDLTTNNLYYKLFNTKRNSTKFLQNIAAFTIKTHNFTPKYIHMNRECLINLTNASDVMRKKKLINQLEYFPEIIKVLFFTTNKKKNQKNPYICNVKTCKLTALMPRYMSSVEVQNTDFIVNFHDVFCNYTSKMNLFEFLGNIFPDVATSITTTIKYIYVKN